MAKAMSGNIEPATLRRKTVSGHGLELVVSFVLWLNMHSQRSCGSLINPRRACAARVTVVGSVCVSVKSHLTYGASIRPENAVTYSAGNGGQKLCGVFSENAPLQS